MSWARVEKGKKPIGWWYHKLMCEIGWWGYSKGWKLGMYYKHLNIMVNKYKINLYGKPL